jgi:hypothetical protein
LRGYRRDAIQERPLVEYHNLDIQQFDIKTPGSVKPVMIKFEKYRCSGTIFTQIIDGKPVSTFVTAGHCLSDSLKIVLQQHIQFLNPLNETFDGLNDGTIAISMKALIKYAPQIQFISLDKITDPTVLKIMKSYNNTTLCKISKPLEPFNINGITMIENPNRPEYGMQTGVDAMVGQPGKSGSVVFYQGIYDGKLCYNPKLMLFGGKSTKVHINKLLMKKPIGDFIEDAYLSNINRVSKQSFSPSATLLFSTTYRDLESPIGETVVVTNSAFSSFERSLAAATFQLESFKNPSKLVKSVEFTMDGIKYRITRSPNPADTDNPVEILP